MSDANFGNVAGGLALIAFACWIGQKRDTTEALFAVLLMGILARYVLDVPGAIVGSALAFGAISRYLAFLRENGPR